MASRTGITIYIAKYFMAFRNCINIFVLYGLDVLHGHIPYIRTLFYVYVCTDTYRIYVRFTFLNST